jgi:hypothetical protein
MRRSLLRGLLVLATTASIGLVTMATTAAGAATTHSSSHPLTASSVQLRAPVSGALTTARLRDLPDIAAAPDGITQVSVYPRLSLEGCSRQDGYNGNVAWATFPQSFVETWGELWDVCGTTAYLYMSWYDPDYENAPIGTAPAYSTTGQDAYYSTFPYEAGYIQVTVCANWPATGWTCGTPYKAQT